MVSEQGRSAECVHVYAWCMRGVWVEYGQGMRALCHVGAVGDMNVYLTHMCI